MTPITARILRLVLIHCDQAWGPGQRLGLGGQREGMGDRVRSMSRIRGSGQRQGQVRKSPNPGLQSLLSETEEDWALFQKAGSATSESDPEL